MNRYRRCYGCGQADPPMWEVISNQAFRRDAFPRVFRWGKACKRYYCDRCYEDFREETEMAIPG